MNTHDFALTCAALSGILLSGVGTMHAAVSTATLLVPSGRMQAAQAPGNQDPPASDTTRSNGGGGADTATREDASAASKDTSKSAGSKVSSSPAASLVANTEDYRIGAGDVLHISVWKEPDASIAGIVVRPDGKITMPLLKDIEVAGLTPREAEKLIAQKLSTFITDANVTVIVTGINSQKIYIIGAVKREGPLAYTYRMTIMQALIEAGGLTEYAKRKKIYVLRASNGKETKIPFDYDAVLKGKDQEHVWLLPNDTLVVPH